MSVDGTTITDPQIRRVKTWAIFNANTVIETWCNVGLDPSADTALKNKDRTRVAAKYNELWPDPQVTATTSGNWTCPDGVFQIAVECFAAGGDGGASISAAGGGGGGGGAYARLHTFGTTPGTVYAYHVGVSAGADSWFGDTSTCFAEGGNNGGNAALVATPGVGGLGGNANHCVGDVTWSGGNGSAGTTLAPGAGGGGAGEDGDGGSAGAAGPFGGPGMGGNAAALLLGSPGAVSMAA